MLETQDSMLRQDSAEGQEGGELPGVPTSEEQQEQAAAAGQPGSKLYPTASDYVASEMAPGTAAQPAASGLPEGWTAGWTPDGTPYYLNAHGQSSWDPPIFLPDGWIQCVAPDTGKSW